MTRRGHYRAGRLGSVVAAPNKALEPTASSVCPSVLPLPAAAEPQRSASRLSKAMKTVYFITHPEVVINPSVPVPQWPLSAQGLARMRRLLRQPWVAQITAVYCSTEQKAIDGAALLAAHLGLPVSHVADRFCRKIRFLGKIQKSGVRNSMTYRLPNSRKSNFATEPPGVPPTWGGSARSSGPLRPSSSCAQPPSARSPTTPHGWRVWPQPSLRQGRPGGSPRSSPRTRLAAGGHARSP